jgi:membrane protein DedA with SNARE-associated domain
MKRADKIIVGVLAAAMVVQLALWPLLPALVASHPALLELVQGSAASIVNMGARARVGETSLFLAVVLAVPTLMKIDWVFWWAGRRWGDGAFLWLLGGESARNARRLNRLHRLEARFGPLAVVLAYFLPVPTTLIYAAVGDGGMRLWVFLLLDALGTVLWTAALAFAGYAIGQSAVDVADAFARYGLWVSIGAVAAFVAWVGVRRAVARRRTTD